MLAFAFAALNSKTGTGTGTSTAVSTYSIGGTITALTESGLVLQNNAGDDLTVASGATAFTFTTKIAADTAYAVTVKTRPAGLNCTVNSGGSGTASANVSSVAIGCVERISYLYLANKGGNTVHQYKISAVDGTVSALTPSTVALTGPRFAVVHPDSNYLYVSTNSNTIAQYSINATNGTLTPLTPATVATGSSEPYSLIVTPNGKFLYAVNKVNNNISQFSIAANGALSALSPATVSVPSGSGVRAGGVSANSSYLYIGTYNGNTIERFSISGSGTLTHGASVAAGARSLNLVMDSTGTHAYVSNENGNNLTMYSVNSGTGALTSLGNYATAAVPDYICIHPTGNYVYQPSWGTAIYQATRDSGTGLLTAMTPTSYTAPVGGAINAGMIVSPDGKYAYSTGTSLNQMTVNQSNGTLSSNTPASVVITSYSNESGPPVIARP